MSVHNRPCNIYTTPPTRELEQREWRYDVKCRDHGIIAEDVAEYWDADAIFSAHYANHHQAN